jgi:cation:H+ antiporter
VGTIPIMFAVSATTTRGLPIDGNQRLELLITAAQSLFAVSILIDLRITAKGASALVAMSALYVVLAIGRFVRRYRNAGRILRDGIATPYSELNR